MKGNVVPAMPRLRRRSDASEPARPRGYTAKMFLIVASAVGAATLTAVHPQVGLPLSVALAVLGNLYIVTKDSEQTTSKGEEESMPEDRSRVQPRRPEGS
jgi:hypothetical protein